MKHGYTHGYIRVSTGGQTTENQKLAIYEAGYRVDQWHMVHALSLYPGTA